jgi:hypothetical protein
MLWDPIGFVDEAVRRIRALGEVVAIAASHPHISRRPGRMAGAAG